MSRLAVIHNPKARRHLRRPELADVYRDILGNAGDFYVSENLEHLYQISLEMKDRGVDILAINGGDGTLQQTLSAMVRAFEGYNLPAIAILRGGTMNTTAKVMGVRHRAETFLKYIIAKLKMGVPFEYTARRVVKINDQVGFLFGFGMVPNFLEAYYNEGGGPRSALKVIFKSILSFIFRTNYTKELFQPFPADVTVEGQATARGEYTGIMVGSIREVGMGFKVTYRANERNDAFHILISQLTPFQYIIRLHKLFFGWPIRNRRLGDIVTGRVVIKTESPQLITIDGENQYIGDEVDIRTGPLIRFVRS